MKYLLSLALFLGLAQVSLAQQRSLPEAKVQNLSGNWVSIQEVVQHDGPVVLSFWATWCKPCILELNTIRDIYPDWKEEYNVKLVAVSIDDARNTLRVKPLVDGKSWEYEVVLDANAELKRALNVNNIPHTFLINTAGEIVWQHVNYVPGDEDELELEIAKLAQ